MRFLLLMVCGLMALEGKSCDNCTVSKKGTGAAWDPAKAMIVVGSDGPESELYLARVKKAASGKLRVIRTRRLPVPVVKTTVYVKWQWAFSPDGKWLAVDRQIDNRHRRPHGLRGSAIKEAVRLRWTGVIDLSSNRATRLTAAVFESPRWQASGRILGWRGDDCLFVEGRRLWSASPAHPRKTTTLMSTGFTWVVALSPDGQKIVTFDGTEGNVLIKLTDLTTSKARVLLDDPIGQRRRHYAHGGGVNAAFSADSEWVLLQKFVWTGDDWLVTVRLESIDGKRLLFADRFKTQKRTGIYRLLGSAAGKQRFVYFKRWGGPIADTAVILELHKKKVTTQLRKIDGVNFAGFDIQPAWSPDGSHLTWSKRGRSRYRRRNKGRIVSTYHVQSGTVQPLGTLPDPVGTWTWAPLGVKR